MSKGKKGKFRKPPYFKFDVTAWLTDPDVRLMTAEQRGWYINLLAEAWNASNCCYLENDDSRIALYAGLRSQEERERFFGSDGQIVRDRFQTTPDGRYIFNARLLRDFEDVLAWRTANSLGGRRSAARKQQKKQELTTVADSKCTTQSTTKTLDSQPQVDKLREVKVREEKKNKTSPRKGGAADPRHTEFRKLIDAYWRHKNLDAWGRSVKLPWNGSEAKKLSLLLEACPDLDAETVKVCLNHRARSDVVHSERPRKWIEHLLSYLHGPLNEFGKPKEPSNGTGQVSKAQQRQDRNLANLKTAVSLLVGAEAGGGNDLLENRDDNGRTDPVLEGMGDSSG